MKTDYAGALRAADDLKAIIAKADAGSVDDHEVSNLRSKLEDMWAVDVRTVSTLLEGYLLGSYHHDDRQGKAATIQRMMHRLTARLRSELRNSV